MHVILITGGARSGKSSYAEERARLLGGDDVSFVATAVPSDADMEERIARHRLARPAKWETLELASVGRAIVEARGSVVVLDCVTMAAAAAIAGEAGHSRDGVEQAVAATSAEIVHAAASRKGTLLVVSNEVGMSIHPPTPIGIWFQDALGRANQRIAAAAAEVVLLVSGIPVVIKGAR